MSKTYTVKAPDGRTITLQGPDDASPDEVIAQAQRLYGQQYGGNTQPASVSPTLQASREAASKGEFEVNQPQSTIGTRTREAAIGLLEPFTAQSVKQSVEGLSSALMDMITGNGTGKAQELVKGLVTAPAQPVVNLYEGIKTGDYDRAAYGAGGFASQTAPAIEGGVSAARAVPGMTRAAVEAVAPNALPAASDLLKKSAAKGFEKVLAPTTRETKYLSRQVAPELAQRGVQAWTEGALRSMAESNKAKFGQAISRAFENLPEGESFNKQGLLSDIDALKKDFTVDGVQVMPDAIAKIDELRGVIDQFGDEISPQSLRKTRQIWDSIVDQSKGFGGKDLKATSETFAQKQVADILRKNIAEKYPDIKNLNAEFSFWSKVDDILAEKAMRETGRSSRLRDLMTTTSGAVVGSILGGPVGTAVGAAGGPAIIHFMQSPAWRTTSSRLKMAMANAIERGQIEQAVALIPPERQLTAGARQMPAPDTTQLTVTTGSPLIRGYEDLFMKDGPKAVVATGPAKGMTLDSIDVDAMTGRPTRYHYIDSAGRKLTFTTKQ